MSAEISQRAKASEVISSGVHTHPKSKRSKITNKWLEDDVPPATEREIIDLLVGEDKKLDLEGLDGVSIGLSSEEEEEKWAEDNFSMTESDYPLRDNSLLQKLLYSEVGVSSFLEFLFKHTHMRVTVALLQGIKEDAMDSDGIRYPNSNKDTGSIVSHVFTHSEVNSISCMPVIVIFLMTVSLQNIMHELDECFILGKGTVWRGITDI